MKSAADDIPASESKNAEEKFLPYYFENGRALPQQQIDELVKVLLSRHTHIRYAKSYLQSHFGITLLDPDGETRGGIIQIHDPHNIQDKLLATVKIKKQYLDKFIYKAFLLGVGANGKVKLIQDLKSGEDAALKVVYGIDDTKVKKEARLLAKAGKGNGMVINKIDKDGEIVEGKYYIVMNLVKGENLLDVIRSGPEIALDKRFDMAFKILDEIQALHDLQIVHCDIKLQNFIFNSDISAPILIDLSDANDFNTPFSEVGYSGTPAHIAPEIERANYRGRNKPIPNDIGPECKESDTQVYTTASDIFSSMRILQDLFGIRDSFTDMNDPKKTVIEFGTTYEKDFLRLSEAVQNKFKQLIARIGHMDPIQRPSIAKIKEELLLINNLIKTNYQSNILLPNTTEIAQLAIVDDVQKNIKKKLYKEKLNHTLQQIYEAAFYANSILELNTKQSIQSMKESAISDVDSIIALYKNKIITFREMYCMVDGLATLLENAKTKSSNTAELLRGSANALASQLKSDERVSPRNNKDIAVIASDLFKISKNLFAKISEDELDGIEGPTPNVTALRDKHYALSSWVLSDILSSRSMGEKTLAMECWIRIMEKCYGHGDYHSVTAILKALDSAAIKALTHSDQGMEVGLSETARECLFMFKLTMSAENYQSLEKNQPSIIPDFSLLMDPANFTNPKSTKVHALQYLTNKIDVADTLADKFDIQSSQTYQCLLSNKVNHGNLSEVTESFTQKAVKDRDRLIDTNRFSISHSTNISWDKTAQNKEIEKLLFQTNKLKIFFKRAVKSDKDLSIDSINKFYTIAEAIYLLANAIVLKNPNIQQQITVIMKAAQVAKEALAVNSVEMLKKTESLYEALESEKALLKASADWPKHHIQLKQAVKDARNNAMKPYPASLRSLSKTSGLYKDSTSKSSRSSLNSLSDLDGGQRFGSSESKNKF